MKRSEALEALRALARYKTHGGYTWAAVMSDGDLMCVPCVRSNYREVFKATRDKEQTGFAVQAITNSGESEQTEFCCQCNEPIWEEEAESIGPEKGPAEVNPEALARRFAAILGQWLTSEQRGTVLERNRIETTDSCHSHDFCDPNMAMLEALAKEMNVKEDDVDLDAAADIMNAAWKLAKANEFWWNQQPTVH